MNELIVSVKAPPKAAAACLASMRPEIDSDTHARSAVDLRYDGGLVLTITAKDLHAMRAAANTYIRWLDMCLRLAR